MCYVFVKEGALVDANSIHGIVFNSSVINIYHKIDQLTCDIFVQMQALILFSCLVAAAKAWNCPQLPVVEELDVDRVRYLNNKTKPLLLSCQPITEQQ